MFCFGTGEQGVGKNTGTQNGASNSITKIRRSTLVRFTALLFTKCYWNWDDGGKTSELNTASCTHTEMKTSVGNPEGERSFLKSSRRWKDIKINITQIGPEREN